MKTLKLYIDSETVNIDCITCLYAKVYIQVDNLAMLWQTDSMLITYFIGF